MYIKNEIYLNERLSLSIGSGGLALPMSAVTKRSLRPGSKFGSRLTAATASGSAPRTVCKQNNIQ